MKEKLISTTHLKCPACFQDLAYDHNVHVWKHPIRPHQNCPNQLKMYSVELEYVLAEVILQVPE